MRKMNEFQILDQVVPDSTSLQQRSIFQVHVDDKPIWHFTTFN